MSAQITPVEINEKEINEKIEFLIDEYGDEVLRVCYSYLQSKEKAEDAFQETFIKVYKNIHKFKGEASEKTWIIRIAINTCKDILKTSWIKRVIFLEDTVIEDGYSMEESIIDNLNNSVVGTIIKELPKKYKDILILYYYHGYSIKEIGNIVNIKEDTIKNRLFRARNMIKNKLKYEEE